MTNAWQKYGDVEAMNVVKLSDLSNEHQEIIGNPVTSIFNLVVDPIYCVYTVLPSSRILTTVS